MATSSGTASNNNKDIYFWLENARPKLLQFKEVLQRHPSKQDLNARLSQILAINANTPRTPELAASIASIKNEMTSLINELKTQSAQRSTRSSTKAAVTEEDSIPPASSNSNTANIKSSPGTKTTSTSPTRGASAAQKADAGKVAGGSGIIKSTFADRAAATESKLKSIKPQQQQQIKSLKQRQLAPREILQNIELSMLDLKRMMLSFFAASEQVATVNAVFAKVKAILQKMKEEYAAYRSVVASLENEIGISKLIMSVATTLVEDIDTYATETAAAPKEAVISIDNSSSNAIGSNKSARKESTDGDNDDDDDDNMTENPFTRKVTLQGVVRDITTMVAMVLSHVENAAAMKYLDMLEASLLASKRKDIGGSEEDEGSSSSAREESSPKRTRK